MLDRVVSVVLRGRKYPDSPASKEQAATRMWLASLLLTAFAVRFYVCFLSGVPIHSTDTHVYIKMADAILQGTPISDFPNGYPLIIATSKLLVGDTHVLQLLLWLNVVMSTGVVLATFSIARSITTSRRVALVAAGLVALWPNQINYARQLTSEVPATFFLTLALASTLGSRSLLAGVFFSTTALLRNSLLLVGPLEAVCLFIARRRVEGGFLVAGLVLVMAAEWLLIKFGVVRAASNFGMNLVIAIGSNSSDGIDYSARIFSAREKSEPVLTYLRFAVDHPGDFLWQRFSALWELWGPWPNPGDVGAPRSTMTRLLIGLRFPALLLAMVAVWFGRWRAEIWCLAAPVALVTAIHTVFFSTPRFTCPVEPAILLLATIGVAKLMAPRRGEN